MNPRSRAAQTAHAEADDHAVCLIGWEKPMPGKYGDNYGIWPVRVVVTRKEETAHDRADMETPHVNVVRLAYVMVPTKAHAERLKRALDEVLFGEQESQSNEPLLKPRWRDVRGCFEENDETTLDLWWGLVLEDAQALLRRQGRITERIDTYDADEAFRRLSLRTVKGRA